MEGRFVRELLTGLRGLRELFFTRSCTVCDAALDVDEEHLCTKCLGDIPFTYFWTYSENAAMERFGGKCLVYNAASLFFYRHGSPYTAIVTECKYGRRESLGLWAGRMLGERLASGGLYGGVQAIIPVPLHPLRRFKRGFNQAETISRGIAEKLPGTFLAPKLLRRRRYTSTQTRKSAQGRARNVSGAFCVNQKAVQRLLASGVRHVLIVDDVLTTGATLGECVRLLQGSFTVSVATLGFVE